jgi:hypothetical protein
MPTGDSSQRWRASVDQRTLRRPASGCAVPQATTKRSSTRGRKLQPAGSEGGSRQTARSTSRRASISAHWSTSLSRTCSSTPGWADVRRPAPRAPAGPTDGAGDGGHAHHAFALALHRGQRLAALGQRVQHAARQRQQLAAGRVRRTPREWRSNSGSSTSRSRSASSCVTAGWLRPSASAQRFRLPSSASLPSTCRWRRRARPAGG